MVFLEAWRRRHDVRLHEESILPWLLAVANNVVRTRARSMRRHRAMLRRLPVSMVSPDDPEAEAIQRLHDEEQMRRVQTRSATLNPRRAGRAGAVRLGRARLRRRPRRAGGARRHGQVTAVPSPGQAAPGRSARIRRTRPIPVDTRGGPMPDELRAAAVRGRWTRATGCAKATALAELVHGRAVRAAGAAGLLSPGASVAVVAAPTGAGVAYVALQPDRSRSATVVHCFTPRSGSTTRPRHVDQLPAGRPGRRRRVRRRCGEAGILHLGAEPQAAGPRLPPSRRPRRHPRSSPASTRAPRRSSPATPPSARSSACRL